MKVSPDDLVVATKAIELKPTAPDKLYQWNGFHRIEGVPGNPHIVLKTTDGNMWIEWHVPVEGTVEPLAGNVRRKHLCHLKLLLAGGRFTVSQDVETKLLTFHKPPCQSNRFPLTFRMPYEVFGDYPEPDLSEISATWHYPTKILSKALGFVQPFIKAVGGNRNKCCATLYAHGTLITGGLKLLARVEGLAPQGTAEMLTKHISFSATQAKATAEFLDLLGDNVEVSIAEGARPGYIFRDPGTGNKLMFPSIGAEFPASARSRGPGGNPTEASVVDLKSLLTPAKAFSGVVPPDAGRNVNLTFKGENDTASLLVTTPGAEVRRTCSHEFLIFRTMCGGNPATQTKVAIPTEPLIKALEGMDGTSVTITREGNFLTVGQSCDGVRYTVAIVIPRQAESGRADQEEQNGQQPQNGRSERPVPAVA